MLVVTPFELTCDVPATRSRIFEHHREIAVLVDNGTEATVQTLDQQVPKTTIKYRFSQIMLKPNSKIECVFVVRRKFDDDCFWLSFFAYLMERDSVSAAHLPRANGFSAKALWVDLPVQE
jgi:hypothetical protein